MRITDEPITTNTSEVKAARRRTLAGLRALVTRARTTISEVNAEMPLVPGDVTDLESAMVAAMAELERYQAAHTGRP